MLNEQDLLDQWTKEGGSSIWEASLQDDAPPPDPAPPPPPEPEPGPILDSSEDKHH